MCRHTHLHMDPQGGALTFGILSSMPEYTKQQSWRYLDAAAALDKVRWRAQQCYA